MTEITAASGGGRASALRIALSALAVCASLIFQNMLFLETRSLVTLYEASLAAELYASLCLLYFSSRFFIYRRMAKDRHVARKSRLAFALIFMPALFYAAALILDFPFNALSLCTSFLSLASWLVSLLLVALALSARQEVPGENAAQSPNPALSGRENEVAELILRGLTVKETADALFISVATVKTHLRHIYEKTGVRNRAELARAMSGMAD